MSTTCAFSVLRSDGKYKHIFIFTQKKKKKKSVRQGLQPWWKASLLWHHIPDDQIHNTFNPLVPGDVCLEFCMCNIPNTFIHKILHFLWNTAIRWIPLKLTGENIKWLRWWLGTNKQQLLNKCRPSSLMPHPSSLTNELKVVDHIFNF